MIITIEQLRHAAMNKPQAGNMNSAHGAYAEFAHVYGLEQPHRAVHYFAQLMHESADFRYDKEIWGPTEAQKRYEGRSDLGNTQPGDGKRFMGRGPIQLTGRANYAAFTAAMLLLDPAAPDFTVKPDAINTDPWEGTVPLWYWNEGNPTRKSLNSIADKNDIEMITKRINGGRNGLDDRMRRYTRLGLVVLGYGPTDRTAFQTYAKSRGWYAGKVDGLDGPQTRTAIHKALLAMTPKVSRSSDVAAAPVVEEKVIIPPSLDKPVSKTSGLWERIGQIALAGGAGTAAWLQDWRIVLALAGAGVVVATIGIVWHQQIITALKAYRDSRQTDQV